MCSDFLLNKKHDQILKSSFQFILQVLTSIISTLITLVFSSVRSKFLIYDFLYAKALNSVNIHVIKILTNENISKQAQIKNVLNNLFFSKLIIISVMIFTLISITISILISDATNSIVSVSDSEKSIQKKRVKHIKKK